jgi:hypothetical protein
MKTKLVFYGLVILGFFSSCDNTETTFDSAFPKKNKDLTTILGNEITIKRKTDTLYLNISSDKNFNLITYKTGDTLFYGSVSKYRGLYYLSEKIREGYYFIYAVKISDKLITGLGSDWSQMCSAEEEIKKGNFKKLLIYMNSDTTIIRLHPFKDDMKNMYNVIIDKITPDTILQKQELISTNYNIQPFDLEEMELIQKVYPNPTQDYITVDIQNSGILNYQIENLSGTIISQGKLAEKSTKIDLTKLQAGMYILTIINTSLNQKESVKIIKKK